MSLKLVAVSGNHSIAIPVGRTMVVGRSPTCDLPIRDLTVSRRHGELELTAGGLRIRDLGSTNGTFINGARVNEGVAAPGARVAFGKVAFHLEAEDQALPAAAAERPEGDSSAGTAILFQVPIARSGDAAARLTDEAPSPPTSSLGAEAPGGRRAAFLELLLAITRELMQQGDTGRLLEKAARLGLQALSVDRVEILTLGLDGELVPRVSKNRPGTSVLPAIPTVSVPPAPVSPGGAAAAAAAAATAAVIARVPRPTARKAMSERSALLIGTAEVRAGSPAAAGFERAVCAPLIGSQASVLGVINAYSQGSEALGPEDLEPFATFTGMVAAALEYSQLMERARRRAVALAARQRHFAPYLAEQIASQQGELRLEGAKRHAVVLFADLRDFTTLAEGLDPGEIASLLGEFFTEMAETVFEHGGTLDKFLGDAVMALWGAPVPRHDDTAQAVQAAIAMQRGLERLNEGWRRQGRPTLALGIGMDLGQVFAGDLGSDRRQDFTAIGAAVNRAAHLCRLAGPGEILITPRLFEAIPEPVPVEGLTPRESEPAQREEPAYRIDWRTPPTLRQDAAE
ncbi:MAG TPA: adenylate/guanylate cyclase domain-containing protein [Thermoanaerobaculia bacterium]|nr:adenylate/guanylate cyclase domain-containing protein [Thermoanaerobaculia bacterium]